MTSAVVVLTVEARYDCVLDHGCSESGDLVRYSGVLVGSNRCRCLVDVEMVCVLRLRVEVQAGQTA